jgi:hypothetical protein
MQHQVVCRRVENWADLVTVSPPFPGRNYGVRSRTNCSKTTIVTVVPAPISVSTFFTRVQSSPPRPAPMRGRPTRSIPACEANSSILVSDFASAGICAFFLQCACVPKL